MSRNALGFNIVEVDPTQKLYSLPDLDGEMNLKYEIDVSSKKGKLTIEVFFDEGLEVIEADDVIRKTTDKGYILATETDKTKIDAALTDNFIKFENAYNTTTLTLTLQLAGKAGGTVGGDKAGGGVGFDDDYKWP